MVRILVAEDEARMAVLIRDGLCRDGYTVEIVEDGDTALTLAIAAPFDLLLLDIMLPRLDGFAVCRKLRQAGAQTAVLMLTARSEVDDRVAGLDAGADDYLVKPFAMSELLARVRALSRRAGGSRDATLRVGDLEIDLLRYEARRGSEQLELTAREYTLLTYLARNAGQPRSRAQILDAVWGEDAEPDGNVVDQYIYYLRTKLERHGSRLIHTVRGVGYLLRE